MSFLIKLLVPHSKSSIKDFVSNHCNPNKRWFRKLSLFHKIIKNQSPSHLYLLIPKSSTSYSTRNSKIFSSAKGNRSFFNNIFLPSTIIDWNKCDVLRDLVAFVQFKKSWKTLLHGCFSRFLNYKCNQIAQRTANLIQILALLLGTNFSRKWILEFNINSLGLTYLTRLRVR